MQENERVQIDLDGVAIRIELIKQTCEDSALSRLLHAPFDPNRTVKKINICIRSKKYHLLYETALLLKVKEYARCWEHRKE